MTITQSPQYDTLFTNARICVPGKGFVTATSLAVKDGVIAKISSDLKVSDASNIIDVGGHILTAGLIDIFNVRPLETSDDVPRMLHRCKDRFDLADLVRVLRGDHDPVRDGGHARALRCSSTSSPIPFAARSSIRSS